MPLVRVASVLGVSRTELARLFGVRRQAIEQWRTESHQLPQVTTSDVVIFNCLSRR
jgi:DNA-binding XRE family transcriptional regulator